MLFAGNKAYCYYPTNERHDYFPKKPEMITLPADCNVAGPIIDKRMNRILAISSNDGQN